MNKCEQVEQVLTDALRCSDIGTRDLEQVGPHILDEVSPLDETALETAVSIPSNVRLETSRLGPMMTGPTKSKDCRGMKLQVKSSYHRDREFPRSPEGARTRNFTLAGHDPSQRDSSGDMGSE